MGSAHTNTFIRTNNSLIAIIFEKMSIQQQRIDNNKKNGESGMH